MRALLASSDLLTSPVAEPSISNQEPNKSQTGVQYPRQNIPRLRLNVFPSTKTQLCSPRNKEHEELRSLSSDNTKGDKYGQHFLFDTRWRNGIYNRNEFRDGTAILPPVSQDYHVHRSHNLRRFCHQKQLSYRITTPCMFGLSDEYELTSVPSVLLTVATPTISGRSRFSEHFNYRSKVNKRVHKLFSAGFNNTTQSYPDPVLGAPASFVQRISEISSLQAETVRQEKIKNLKKNKRQEA
ncbi:uncharacterized protein [Salminus brasiliensis]|uniref:uncharacterized protein isoform X2 n=1 Tax=Salminus brasiliensis TaxID=930266 RepID=UPI003B82FC11